MDVLNDDGDSPIDLSIVIPLFNEEGSVPELVEALDDALRGIQASASHGTESDGVVRSFWMRKRYRCEIILVDDGSTDSTVQRALDSSGSTLLPVRVIRLQRNFGQTAAMQAGIDAARGGLIATLDGDLQNDPHDIPRMIEHLEANDLDLLVGWRKQRHDGLFLRLIPSWIANRLIGRITGVKIHDYGCSLKIYRASVIQHVKLMGEMHRFIPAWVATVTHPSRISEIEVNHRSRQSGVSKYGISRTIRVALDLLSVLFFMRFRARPGHFFGMVGIAFGVIGAAMLSSVLISKYGFGEDIGTRPMLLIGAFAVLSSIQFACFGVMAEMLTRIYDQTTGHATYIAKEITPTADYPISRAVPSLPSNALRHAG